MTSRTLWHHVRYQHRLSCFHFCQKPSGSRRTAQEEAFVSTACTTVVLTLCVMQVPSLQLLQPYLTAANAAPPSPILLPRLLAAAASSTLHARALALDCLLAAASHPELAEHGLVSAQLLAGNHLQAFLHALALHHEDIKGDSLGLLQAAKRLLPDVAAKGRAARHGHAHKAG